MLTFLQNNLATIVIGLILLAVVCLVIYVMGRDKKAGKSACGCSCSGCPSAGMCHSKMKP